MPAFLSAESLEGVISKNLIQDGKCFVKQCLDWNFFKFLVLCGFIHFIR